MPRYDYRCTTCEATYELSRPMAEADEPEIGRKRHKRRTVFGLVGGTPRLPE